LRWLAARATELVVASRLVALFHAEGEVFVSMTALTTVWLALAVIQLTDSTGPASGAAAPAFSNRGADGRTYSLEGLKGKWIVLEWYNPSCPYTRGHYDHGSLPALQREWTGKGVVWLSVSTTARLERAAAFARSKQGAATSVLDDTEAATARAYGAKTTPHMFVIDPKGVLIYKGALDDRPEPARRSSDSRNFVSDALTQAMSGRPVETPVTTPYGCAVNYEP
jgi:peroxiredoxin